MASKKERTGAGAESAGYLPRERVRFAWAIMSAFLVLVTGVAATLLFQQWLRVGEEGRVRDTFKQFSRERLVHLQWELETHALFVQALGAFYASSVEVESAEFGRFVRPFSSQLEGFVAAIWAAREAGGSGRPGAEVLEGVVPGRFRVRYVEPEGEGYLLGRDLYVMGQVRAALDRACDEAASRASEPMFWPGASAETRVVVLAAPVYAGGVEPESVAERRAQLAGYVVAVYDLDRLLRPGHSLLGAELGLEIGEQSPSGMSGSLAVVRNWSTGAGADEAGEVWEEEEEVLFGGRQWRLSCLARRGSLVGWRSRTSGLIVVVGLLITALVAGHLFVQVSRSARTARVVRERTAELHQANSQLEREVAVRHTIESTLRESRRMLSMLLSNLPGMAYRCRYEPNWRMEFVSEGCGQLTGYEPPELINNQVVSYVDLVEKEDRHRLWMEIQAAVAKRHAFQVLYRIRRRDGQVRWVWELGRGVFRGDGEVEALEGFVTDIDSQMRAQQELERLNAALREKNRELEVLLYATSHDLRSPLVNIMGFSRELEKAFEQLRGRLVESGGDDGVKVEKLVEEEIPESLMFIRVGVDKMDKLLKGLLHLSRLGRVDFQVEELDIKALVGDVVDTLHYQCERGGVRIEVGELPRCYGDATQVSRVFANLLDNALKYLSPERPGQIEVAGRVLGGQVEYRVSDNGVGIAAEHHEAVFELCRRLDAAPEGGEGLGLTIAQRIVRRHNGRMWLESVVGEGSSFFFTLPDHAFVPDKPFDLVEGD